MDEYTEWLIGAGLKPKTVRTYQLALLRALAWAAGQDLDLRYLKPSQAVELSDLWPHTNSSRRQLRSALVHYWEMCGVAGVAKAIRVPPRPKPRWRGLEDDQVRALLTVANQDWPRGGVVRIGIYLGLRREEIATLRWADFDSDLTWVRVMGKGDRTRYVPVHPRIQVMLYRQRWPGEYVFPGRLGGHVSLTTVNNWLDQLAVTAGLGHIHPHQMRHTFGGKINDESRDVYLAKDLLGHEEVKTTEVYSRMKRDRLVEGIAYLDWEDDAA